MNNTRFQLKELYSNENWDSNKIDENFIISYKIFSETNTVSIRADAELEIPWFNLVALVYEIDLFVYWFPFCKSARTVS